MKRSIRSVLVESCAAKPIGIGSEAEAFDFPIDLPDLQPWVIRKTTHFDPEWLKAHSALTPVTPIISGMHVGQPLLSFDLAPGLNIHPRQRGKSLAQWRGDLCNDTPYEPYSDESCDAQTCIRMYDTILAMAEKSGNPFTPVFENTYALGRVGYYADGCDNNIFIDPHSAQLSMIDQFDKHLRVDPRTQGERNIYILEEGLREGLHLEPPALLHVGQPLRDEHAQKRQAVIQLLSEAKAWVIANPNTACAPLAIAKVNDIQAVGLHAPPHHLVEKLRQLEARARIPGR